MPKLEFVASVPWKKVFTKPVTNTRGIKGLEDGRGTVVFIVGDAATGSLVIQGKPSFEQCNEMRGSQMIWNNERERLNLFTIDDETYFNDPKTFSTLMLTVMCFVKPTFLSS